MGDRSLNAPSARDPRVDALAQSSALLAESRATQVVSPELRALADALGALPLDALPPTYEGRVAFWVNVYNALMRHAVLTFDLRAGARVPLGVFHGASYLIGGQRFSLHVIEHGVLRCNRPAPFTLWRPLRPRDPRASAAPTRFDPRVHFALNCAAASCPPVRDYRAETLDASLDLATRSYVQDETSLDAAKGLIRLPYLCSLYDRDFGPPREALRWLRPYLSTEHLGWLDAHPEARIGFSPYRWELLR